MLDAEGGCSDLIMVCLKKKGRIYKEAHIGPFYNCFFFKLQSPLSLLYESWLDKV